jgi:putative redox protein
MTEVSVSALNKPGGYRTTIETDLGGHTIIADEPSTSGGTDEGPESHSLLASALATCIVMTLRMYVQRKQWPLGEVKATVVLRKEGLGDNQHTTFFVTLSLGGELTSDQQSRLMEIAGRCPIHRILSHPIEIRIEPGN